MQPLYLEGLHPVSVALEEGPALAITRSGEATRLLPLSLLSHIIARGDNIQWSQTALTTCAEAGIPIFFSDEHHHLIATLRANSESPAQDWLRFMRLIEDPDGIDHYQQFIQAKQTQMQKDISERWREIPEIRLPGYHRVARIIRSAIHADVEAELHRRGFRRRTAVLRQAGLNLPKDLLKVLEPCVHWVINETWKRNVIAQQPASHEPPSRRAVLYAYETHSELVRDSIRALIIAFLYWIAEGDSQYIMTGER